MDSNLPWLEEKKKINIDKKKLAGIGVVILIFIIIIYTLVTNLPINEQVEIEQNNEPAILQVHVSGAVVNPGVYKLETGSRIIDAINAAGGFTSEAVQDNLNLAKPVEDGEQIKVSTNTPAQINNGKININTADLSQLQSLNGVGPSTAQKIIDYRNANGSFKTIEDLKKVSGIGDKTYAKFADKICV